MGDLQDRIRELSPELQREVGDFVEFLLAKQRKPRRAPTLGWAGAAEDLREQYTSVDPQHKIAQWRIGGS